MYNYASSIINRQSSTIKLSNKYNKINLLVLTYVTEETNLLTHFLTSIRNISLITKNYCTL